MSKTPVRFVVMLTTAWLIIHVVNSETWPRTYIRQFCVDLLSQTDSNVETCYKKRQEYSINGSREMIPYLCCLGLFDIARYNYTTILTLDLMEYAAGAPSGEHFLQFGRFIQTCKSNFNSTGKALTRNDYFTWLSRGVCITNWV